MPFKTRAMAAGTTDLGTSPFRSALASGPTR